MRRRKSIWREHSPESLKFLSIRSCVENLDEFSKQLEQDICLPSQICEEIIAYTNVYDYKILCPNVLNLFCDYADKLPIKNLILSNTDIPAALILKHRLSRLELHCVDPNVSDKKKCNNIAFQSEALESLYLDLTMPGIDLDKFDPSQYRERPWSDEREFVESITCDLKNARHIACKQYEMEEGGMIDAAHAISLKVIGNEDEYVWKCNPHILTSLTLTKGELTKEHMDKIMVIKNLQHLDISFSETEYLDEPESVLRTLIHELVHLKSLDISGTEFVRNPTKDIDCDIDGLEERIHNPLDYVGVYTDSGVTCPRVPAKVVAGTYTVEQIICAAEKHFEKSMVLRRILARYLEFFGRPNTKIDIERGLDVVVQGLEYHLFKDEYGTDDTLPISGAACIYELISLCGEYRRNEQEVVKRITLSDINIGVKKRIIWVLIHTLRLSIRERNELWSLGGGQGSRAVLYNSLLALWQFNVPEDIALLYREMVEVLIGVVNSREDSHLQKLSILMLNSMVCYAEGEKKKILGLEIVETIVKSIERQIQTIDNSDQLLESSWTTLWNVTDETPEHSLKFIKLDGLKLFLRCKEKFPNSLNLLKNMMGLLGNIAEDLTCRNKLMQNKEIIKEFSLLLDSQSDGIEVSYNAAGVVSHLGSDGEKAWTLEDPSRQFVLNKMVQAINRWPVDSDRSINYRSLVPILQLLQCPHCPEAQLWAAWAVANLSTFDAARFGRLAVEEGGDKMIKNFDLDSYRPDLREKMTELREIILENTKPFTTNPS